MAAEAERKRRRKIEAYYSQIETFLDRISEYSRARGLLGHVSTIDQRRWSERVRKAMRKRHNSDVGELESYVEWLRKNCIELAKNYNDYCVPLAGDVKHWLRRVLDFDLRKQVQRNAQIGRERQEFVALADLCRKDCF